MQFSTDDLRSVIPAKHSMDHSFQSPDKGPASEGNGKLNPPPRTPCTGRLKAEAEAASIFSLINEGSARAYYTFLK